MNCSFTGQTCRYIDCGAWNERLQACRFVLMVDKILDGEPPKEQLTPKEQQILELMTQGYYNRQISDALSIGYQTVKNNVSSILTKLGAKSRTEAVVMSFKRADKIDEARARA